MRTRVLGLIVLAVGLSCLAATPVSTIKVGALYNLTGGMSSSDGPGLQGMRLAVEEINAGGGVLGRLLELVAIDGKSDQTQAADAALRLVQEERVVAVGGLNDSTYALAAGPVFQRARIPFVIAGATLPDLPERIGEHAFMVPFGDNAQAYAMAEYAYRTLGARSIAILHDLSYDFTLALHQFFRARWVTLAGAQSIRAEDIYRSGEKDFSHQIARLRGLSRPPDALFVSALPEDAGTIVQQLRAAGFTQPILSGDGFDTPLLLQVAGNAADHVYFATHVALSSPVPKVAGFVRAYRARYGREPENAFTALGYDTLHLIADAIRRAGAVDPMAITAALAVTQGFQGVTGTIGYAGGSRLPRKSVSIIRVQDGRFGFAAEVIP
jgi:branched-chain amino acid transport system substrate-binding protein